MSVSAGRFRERLHPEAVAFSSSLPVDNLLFREDIEGSLAHNAMLARQKIIPAREAAKIRKALRGILRELDAGRLTFLRNVRAQGRRSPAVARLIADDIHMAIEDRLIRKVGRIGGKLHTARSRNDQVALDERLYLRGAIGAITASIVRLQRVVVAKARRYQHVLMPGYTHLQRAQPVLLAHHLLAYVAMLERDRERFGDAFRRLNRSPLGAGALAGTPFPIDRRYTAGRLGFDGIVENSIDAVGDRDALIEFIAACAIAMMHLSRFAGELVLWSSQEWKFAAVGDAFTTGSSIMPQKKNPDVAELVRGKTGRVYGDLMALLTVMKGLPLAYNRDMQEDKQPLFDSSRTLIDSLRVFSSMVAGIRFERHRFDEELKSDFLLATELADHLAREGVPFRNAHAIVGKIVRDCERRKISLRDLSVAEYRRYSKHFPADVLRLLDPATSLSRKRSEGSTSPGEVEKALRRWERKLRN